MASHRSSSKPSSVVNRFTTINLLNGSRLVLFLSHSTVGTKKDGAPSPNGDLRQAHVDAPDVRWLSPAVQRRRIHNDVILFEPISLDGDGYRAMLAALAALQPLFLMPEKPSVFLSYAREDRARVEQVYDSLKAEGFNPW